MIGLKKDKQMSAYVDLLIHEQYFYPFYTAYQPDYRQKVLTAVNGLQITGMNLLSLKIVFSE